MTARTAQPGETGLERLDVQLLSEDELLAIIGGGPIMIGALVALTGAGIALVGIAVGVAVYWAVHE